MGVFNSSLWLGGIMNKSLITEPLGLFRWSHLEHIILAALTNEAPMLLIGEHGSAKSFILERLAEALKMEFKFYNTSLINYDFNSRICFT